MYSMIKARKPTRGKKDAPVRLPANRSAAAHISATALAQRWCVSLPAIYRMIERGELASLRIGVRSVRILLSAVEKYEREHTIGEK